MTKVANTSKGPKTYEQWIMYKKANIPVDPEFRSEMMRIEKTVELMIQEQIDNFNK